MKESCEALAIDGYKCNQLPKFVQGALTYELDHGCPNAPIVWLSWSANHSPNLCQIPVIKTVKDIYVGQEITIKTQETAMILSLMPISCKCQ